MRLHICAVGKLRSGAERSLFDDYTARFDKTGRALSLGPLALLEVEDKKNLGPKAEAALLRRVIPAGSAVIALDERGETLSSPQFAALMARFRDEGSADLAFLIGGADGLDPRLSAGANTVLSFGAMVWPHMLIRAMLSEQIYRAASILAGHPYHRV